MNSDFDLLSATVKWIPIDTDCKGVVLHQDSQRKYRFRLETTIEKSAEITFSILEDATRRKQWDTMCSECYELDHSVIYYKTKALWPTSARDCVLMVKTTRLCDGSILSDTCSTVHPLMPQQKGVVRLQIEWSGQIIIPINDNSCRIVQVIEADPGGYVPQSIINYMSKVSLPKTLISARTVIELYQPIEEHDERFFDTMEPSSKSSEELDPLLELSKKVESLNQSIMRLRTTILCLTVIGFSLYLRK